MNFGVESEKRKRGAQQLLAGVVLHGTFENAGDSQNEDELQTVLTCAVCLLTLVEKELLQRHSGVSSGVLHVTLAVWPELAWCLSLLLLK